ncbi:MAG: hypothetical protein WBD79_26960, partial [Anaerolineae bacterium]
MIGKIALPFFPAQVAPGDSACHIPPCSVIGIPSCKKRITATEKRLTIWNKRQLLYPVVIGWFDTS